MARLKPNGPCPCGSGQKFKRCCAAAYRPIRAGALSDWRTLPDSIDRPHFADAPDGDPGDEVESMVKSDDVINRMRRVGKTAADVLATAGAAVEPGITTDRLDEIVHEECRRLGVYPSPLNYKMFPKSVCTSVNEVICHGIPDNRTLVHGDIISIDVTVFAEGVHGDNCATWVVGDTDPDSKRLINTTRRSLEAGVAAVKPGRPISDIGKAIEGVVEPEGFAVVREFIGHGVGTEFHTEPIIYHYYEPRATTIMEPGMTFTIEPMVAMGGWRMRIWDDNWTAVTIDGSRAAQFEHSLVVTGTGAELLTPAVITEDIPVPALVTA